MTGSLLQEYRETLSQYSDELLDTTSRRTARFLRSKKRLGPIEKLEKALANQRGVERLIAELHPTERQALAVFYRAPRISWRWDHAVRLLVACGVDSPYESIQALLAEGLLCMRSERSDRLARFHVPDAVSYSSLPMVRLAAPLVELQLDLPTPTPPMTGRKASLWRGADGWDLPLRLAVLWRLAWRAPFKRTQQNQLFKRDQERIGESPLLTAPLLDAPAPVPELGYLTYELAVQQGWFGESPDEQVPIGTLREIWPESLSDALLACAGGLMSVERWNELGAETPVGSFCDEVPTARFLLLMLLATLDGERGVGVDELAERLEAAHPPWNGEGDLVGPFRSAQQRAELARRWTRACLFGPLFQAGLVEIAQSEDGDLARLSPLGRAFMGLPADLPEPQGFPHTLLAQPNHEIIVYRQGLSTGLLADLVLFAEPKSLGAALTFEINADSVYHALEAGMTAEGMIDLLVEHGGRPLPSGLTESIRTWAQKRDRVSLFADCVLFEFNDERDLRDAVERGLEGIQLTERMLLAPADKQPSFKNLRITASRDYQFASEPCVAIGPDGITLKVDLSKSDLMLESELNRFAELVPFKDREGRRQFRMTRDSIDRAYAQGLDAAYFEDWFRRRAGQDPPPSVFLLTRAATGLPMKGRRMVVLRAESAAVAEGLLQHPLTAEWIGERLGPDSLEIPADNLEPLAAALNQLGVELAIEDA